MHASKWATPPAPQPANPATSTSANPPTQSSGVTGLDMPDPASFPIDEFAQTRPPDDLFGDDFTPIAQPLVEQPPPPQPAQPPTGPRAGVAPRGGRGRGARTEPRPDTRPKPAPKPTPQPDAAPAAEGDTAAAATAPADGDAPRVEAVRGDRSGTGGVKKAKLSEAELSARMAAIKLKNANLEAAHARAEADEASFQAREAEAQARRRVERANRQQLVGEREKNRLRKLQAVKGREWDADKEAEEAAADRGGRRYMRGAHGGVAGPRVGGHDGVDEAEGHGDELEAHADGYRGRGRGRGRARGRGRGGLDGGRQPAARNNGQSVPTETDFPALEKPKTASSSSETAPASAAPAVPAVVPPIAPVATAGRSWADEMEGPITPVASKPT